MAQEAAKSFLGIPGLDPGPFIGGTFGALTTFAATWANRRFGAGDIERKRREEEQHNRDEYRRKLEERLTNIDKALLRIELKQQEQDAFIEPIREAMQDAIKKRLKEGLA